MMMRMMLWIMAKMLSDDNEEIDDDNDDEDGDTDNKDDDYDDVAAHWFPLRVRAGANCMRHHSSECHILPHNCTIQ